MSLEVGPWEALVLAPFSAISSQQSKQQSSATCPKTRGQVVMKATLRNSEPKEVPLRLSEIS